MTSTRVPIGRVFCVLFVLAAGAVTGGAGLPESAGANGDIVERFSRVATFPVFENVIAAGGTRNETTVAEIVAASRDGRTLVYTDSPGERIGFTDITDPADPQPLGTLAMGGEPTSVAVTDRYALVAVNTSPSFVTPDGELVVVDIHDPTVPSIVTTIDLNGQPDSISISSRGRYAAVVIENERDEDLGDGSPPQLPGGSLIIVDLVGAPTSWTTRSVDLTGIADLFPDDPEPEFVDINENNKAVVTLQENNHIVIVDLKTGTIENDFSAGFVTLHGVDGEEDGVISLTDTIAHIPREPDAVTWINNNKLVTANEGDLDGGSRGFTVFHRNGTVQFDSGASFEKIAVRHGHYPEGRSDAKGTEPEGVTFAKFGGDGYLFVGSERGSFVAVYRITENKHPEFLQLLPSGLGPEGLLPIPQRGLLIVSSEEDAPPLGVRATITIHRLGRDASSYPHLVSTGASPIPWSALSGLTADPTDPTRLYAVWDSYFAESVIFTIDISHTPAVITDAVTFAAAGYDPEGIALAPDGTTWIASEGNASDSVPNLLIKIDGATVTEIGLPDAVIACRAASANRGTLGSGFEGLTVVPDGASYKIIVAQQRGWDYTTAGCEDLDDDPSGANAGEPAFTRLWIYDPTSATWDHTAYELDAKPVDAAWIGLSEVTLVGTDLVLIERDNRTGSFAVTKNLVNVSLASALDAQGVARVEKARFDLIGPLEATNGWITDKPEGFTVNAVGEAFVVTDNDGVDGWSGETQFLRLGPVAALFDITPEPEIPEAPTPVLLGLVAIAGIGATG